MADQLRRVHLAHSGVKPFRKLLIQTATFLAIRTLNFEANLTLTFKTILTLVTFQATLTCPVLPGGPVPPSVPLPGRDPLGGGGGLMEAGVVGGLARREVLGGFPLHLPLASLAVALGAVAETVVAERLVRRVPFPGLISTAASAGAPAYTDVVVAVSVVHVVLAAVKERRSAAQPRASFVLRHGVANVQISLSLAVAETVEGWVAAAVRVVEVIAVRVSVVVAVPRAFCRPEKIAPSHGDAAGLVLTSLRKRHLYCDWQQAESGFSYVDFCGPMS